MGGGNFFLWGKRRPGKTEKNPCELLFVHRDAETKSHLIADPKALLHELLRTASELSGRRRKKFRVEPAAFRVSHFIEDFGPPRELSAFSAFEKETREVLHNHFREFLAP